MSKVLQAHIDVEEKHYTTQELADSRKVHRTTIARLFMDEPGVLLIGHASTRTKRQRYTMRIPATVAERVFARLTVKK